MCGIVGAIAERNIVPILMEGLRRLEYRGYDSAGIAVLNGGGQLSRLRTVGKVRMLQEALERPATASSASPTLVGQPTGCRASATHTRTSPSTAWRSSTTESSRITMSARELKRRGYKFTSETDTEVVAHRIHLHLETVKDLFKAVRATVAELRARMRSR